MGALELTGQAATVLQLLLATTTVVYGALCQRVCLGGFGDDLSRPPYHSE